MTHEHVYHLVPESEREVTTQQCGIGVFFITGNFRNTHTVYIIFPLIQMEQYAHIH